MKTFVTRSLMIAALIASVFMVGGGQANAGANTGRLYIHTLKCNRNVDDLFTDCHNRRIQGIEYTLAGATRVSDRNGTVKWGPGGPRTYRIDTNAAQQANYTGGYMVCTDENTGISFYDGPQNAAFLIINIQPGSYILCDRYLFVD